MSQQFNFEIEEIVAIEIAMLAEMSSLWYEYQKNPSNLICSKYGFYVNILQKIGGKHFFSLLQENDLPLRLC